MRLPVVLLLIFILQAQSCRQSAPGNQEIDLSGYADTGRKIVAGTQAELSRNLMQALQNSGPENALMFCNANALSITDSMGRVFNAAIRRVSDQPRNPLNRANEAELKYIREMKVNKGKGQEMLPKIYALEGKVLGYFPIETNAVCLQCHGIPGSDILPGTLDLLAEIYPNDQATGYAENQLRGIWVVAMERKDK